MKTAVLIFFVALVSVAVNAQYRVVTEEEYRTACGTTIPVPLRARVERYRMILETRSAMEGRPSTDYSSRSITNFQDRAKWHRLSESTFGTTKRVSEEISFEGKMYKKSEGGEWVELDLSSAPPAAKSDTRYLSIEYRLLPDETLKGKKFRVCEKHEVASIKVAGSDAEVRREGTTRYWMTDDGLLKSESSYRNVSEKNTMTSWIKNEWEIDPTITVSLPAKFVQKK